MTIGSRFLLALVAMAACPLSAFAVEAAEEKEAVVAAYEDEIELDADEAIAVEPPVKVAAHRHPTVRRRASSSYQYPRSYYGGGYGGANARSYRGLPQSGVPAGRTYYNNRYYGNFNNRFYGPQYGYF